jgi:hypothetical protein
VDLVSQITCIIVHRSRTSVGGGHRLLTYSAPECILCRGCTQPVTIGQFDPREPDLLVESYPRHLRVEPLSSVDPPPW